MSKSKESKSTDEQKDLTQTQSGPPGELLDLDAWGEEQIDNEDLVLPTIRLLQAQSKMVENGNGVAGEFRNTFDKQTKLGDAKTKTPLEIIPFGKYKTWVIRKNGQFDSIVPVTPDNIDWAWEEEDEDENIIKREKWFNVYCLTPGDVKKGEAFPAVLSFKGKSYKAVKQFATIVKKLQAFKKPMATRVFTVTAEKTTNDKGTFFIMKDVEMGRPTTTEELQAAHEWRMALKGREVKVDYEVDEEGGDSETETQKTTTPPPQAKTKGTQATSANV